MRSFIESPSFCSTFEIHGGMISVVWWRRRIRSILCWASMSPSENSPIYEVPSSCVSHFARISSIALTRVISPLSQSYSVFESVSVCLVRSLSGNGRSWLLSSYDPSCISMRPFHRSMRTTLFGNTSETESIWTIGSARIIVYEKLNFLKYR